MPSPRLLSRAAWVAAAMGFALVGHSVGQTTIGLASACVDVEGIAYSGFDCATLMNADYCYNPDHGHLIRPLCPLSCGVCTQSPSPPPTSEPTNSEPTQGSEGGEGGEGGAGELTTPGVVAEGTVVTYSGYLTDTSCIGQINRNDNTNITLDAPAHTKACMLECSATGFSILENLGSTGHPNFKARFQFDSNGRRLVLEMLNRTCRTDDIQATVTGTVGMAAGWRGDRQFLGQPLGDYLYVTEVQEINLNCENDADGSADESLFENTAMLTATITAVIVLCGMGIMALCFRQARLERDLERSNSQNSQNSRKMAVNESWMPGLAGLSAMRRSLNGRHDGSLERLETKLGGQDDDTGHYETIPGGDDNAAFYVRGTDGIDRLVKPAPVSSVKNVVI